jgi:hypothetical protein
MSRPRRSERAPPAVFPTLKEEHTRALGYQAEGFSMEEKGTFDEYKDNFPPPHFGRGCRADWDVGPLVASCGLRAANSDYQGGLARPN